jgi:hypothetical protein
MCGRADQVRRALRPNGGAPVASARAACQCAYRARACLCSCKVECLLSAPGQEQDGRYAVRLLLDYLPQCGTITTVSFFTPTHTLLHDV